MVRTADEGPRIPTGHTMLELRYVMAATPESLNFMSIQVFPGDFLEGGYSNPAPEDADLGSQ